jgi:serine phosphatase RsbU (regulator of sigma subunit)/tetratricopeptide (TPR) repeat protein
MRPGDDIANCRLIEELGRGAWSTAWLAERGGQRVVVKMLRATVGDEKAQGARFYREVATVACLAGAGIVGLIDVGEVDEVPYYVAQYREGRSLAARLRAGILSHDAALRIGGALARSLAALHTAGFLHRDVKPDNIIVSDDDHAHLIDFGLTTTRDDVLEGVVVGTLSYASPEQIGVIHRATTASSDLYSLGVVLFEALTGSPPCEATSVEALLAWHAAGVSRRPSEVKPGIDPRWDALLGALLALEPDERATRAALAARELDDALGDAFDAAAVAAKAKARCVGRDTLLKDLRTALAFDAAMPRGSFVLTGEAGSGRSTVLRALGGDFAERGGLVLWVFPAVDEHPFVCLGRAFSQWLAPMIARSDAALPDLSQRLRAAAGDFAPLIKRLAVPLEHLLQGAEASRALELTQDPQRFAEIVADFIAAIGERSQGVMLVVDDLDGIDSATLRVLGLLQSVEGVALAMAADVRAEGLSLRAFESARVTDIPTLDAESAREVLEVSLGARRVSRELMTHVTACAGNQPYAVTNYAHALIEAGAVALRDGQWYPREDRVDLIVLPETANATMVSRLESMPGDALACLRVLAFVGTAIGDAALASMLEVSDVEVRTRVATLLRAGLASIDNAGSVRVVHPQIARRLRAETTQDEADVLRLRIAEYAAEKMKDEPIIEARHRLAAMPQGNVRKAIDAALRAARRELARYANEAAWEILSKTLPYVEVDDERAGEFYELYGQSCTRVARIDAALEAFGRALAASRSPMVTARIQVQVARVHMALWNPDGVQAACEAAHAAVSSALPGSGSGADIVDQLRRLRDASATRAQWAPVAELVGGVFGLWGFMAWSSGRPAHARTARAQLERVCAIVGDVSESIELEAWLGYFCAVGALPELATEHGEHALERARRRPDRAVEANVQKLLAWASHVLGRFERNEELEEDALRRFRRWLSARDLIAVCNEYGLALLLRGLCDKAERVARIGLEIADSAGLPSGRANIRATLASALAMRGELIEAASLIEQARTIRAQRVAPRDFWTGTWIAEHRMLVLFEQGEFGAPLDTLRSEAAGLAVAPADWPQFMQMFFVFAAYLLVQRLECSDDDHRAASLVELRSATDDVTSVCSDEPLRRAHERVLRAAIARHDGRSSDATALLNEAESIVRNVPERWVRFEVLRERARLASDRTLRTAAATEARELARKAGWVARERAVLREFPTATASVIASESGTPAPTLGRLGGQARVLDSLLRVALATQTTREPTAQARAVLDELLVVFGGERAFLFAVEPGGVVRRVVGRNGEGRDLSETHGIAMTLVRRVTETGEAQVVAGSEEGALVGSRSAVAHDLRSIMAAPVRIRDRLYGVVYVDSRVVKGLYHRADLDVLVAMAAHIGAGMESARLASVEITERELRKDLELSRAVQRLFFPRLSTGADGRWSLCGHTRAATQCGGDWWWWEPRGDSLVLFLGDVTGHGAAPAMLTASVASVVRASMLRGASLEEALSAVHDEIRTRCEGEYQVQAAAIELCADGELRFHSAGAPPPLVRVNGVARPLVARGTPLGGTSFACGFAAERVPKGARVLLYSDGLTETLNGDGRAFGLRRLVGAFADDTSPDTESVAAAIEAQLNTFRGSVPFADDVTLIALERTC